MGEGREQQPLAIITSAPIEFVEKIDKKELMLDPRDDLYLPLFKNIGKIKNLNSKNYTNFKMLGNKD